MPQPDVKRYARRCAILRRIIKAKAARRRELASLPIEEKIRIVIELQKMESSIRQVTGRSWREPWRIES
jgi:hypothetical protein